MKKITIYCILLALLFFAQMQKANAQSRRPVDSQHPMWLVHIDVWNKADPQKIIDLIPAQVKPFVVLNLSLSCQYDTERNEYKMPQNAVKTYKSWASVCQANNMWFTCQPASGGHTHIQDDDLETFEYFFKKYPNFLGWNYAEQFWGFNEAGDKSSSSDVTRIALFANLVEMSHKYGGFLTVSFCGNQWSYHLSPVGMLKRNSKLMENCKKYPEAMLWLFKYTTAACWYNNESQCFGPFIAGLTTNYGVRYDNCGWDGALGHFFGDSHPQKYPIAAGIGTVMEQTCVNGGAVWDGPELIWTQDFRGLSDTTVNGYRRRNWGTFPGFDNVWVDMFNKIIDGSLYIPTREEVVKKTKIAVINNVTTGSDQDKYATWDDLYDGIYNQTDPFNTKSSNSQKPREGVLDNNYLFYKKTGRYGTIPLVPVLYDDLAKSIPVKVSKSNYTNRWPNQDTKVSDFNSQYPAVSSGDLFVNRYKNQLVTYYPYSYCNSKRTASATIPLQYNTCKSLNLTWGLLSSGYIREYSDHIDFYLNNYRTDTTTNVLDKIVVKGVSSEPSYTVTKRVNATCTSSKSYNASDETFTLEVSHNGPVDVVINCSGSQTGRSTDYINSPNLSLDLPKQPEDFRGDIIIEAEDMDYKNIRSCVTDPFGWYPSVHGHAGNGFMDMGTNTSGGLTHKLNVKESGTYRISLKYTAKSSGTLSSTVNGVSKTFRIEKTSSVNEWKRAKVTATLRNGSNTMVFTNSNGIDMYIDNVTYCPNDIPEEEYDIIVREVEHGRLVASKETAFEGDKITLTAYPDEGYSFDGVEVKHGKIELASDYSFIMPDEYITLSPIFTDMSVVYSMNMSATLAGEIPEGWRSIQEGGAIRDYPANNNQGPRVMSGFTGFSGKGFYWRDGSAEYGRLNNYRLNLQPGWYKLTYNMAAWKAVPQYKACILDANNDNLIAESSARNATPNADGNSGADLSSTSTGELQFQVTTAGNYVIKFYSLDKVSGFDEFLLLDCKLSTIPDPNGINNVRTSTGSFVNGGIYNVAGNQMTGLQQGVNIIHSADGTTKKVLVK